jgi:hypothetical protein
MPALAGPAACGGTILPLPPGEGLRVQPIQLRLIHVETITAHAKPSIRELYHSHGKGAGQTAGRGAAALADCP